MITKLKLILILLLLVLAGCSTTVPVVAKFPEAPKELLVKCEPLQSADKSVTISEFTKIVVSNYEKFHLCANKHSGLVDWYQQQKENFKELK